MKTFNMYVKTLIYNETGKILLLKRKNLKSTPQWDLPGTPLTEDESFDEAITRNIQKVIGYYVYPGKIVGVCDYINRENKEINVIMDATILNGELLLEKNYEEYAWVNIERISEYPLVPWFHQYMKNTRNPFEDVAEEIDEINKKQQNRRDLIKEDMISHNSKDFHIHDSDVGDSVKNSFSLLKNTIVRTFHPKSADVTRTTPKENVIYQREEVEEGSTQEDIAPNPEVVFKNSSDDIIIEHEDEKEPEVKAPKKPEIRKIRENNRPYVRKSKEAKERISFSSESITKRNIRQRLNNLNKTDANKEKKRAPVPKRRK